MYDYADTLVRDKGSAPNNYSLYDFFSSTPQSFRRIQGAKYPTNCFINPHASGCFPNYPMDPDNDVIDSAQ